MVTSHLTAADVTARHAAYAARLQPRTLRFATEPGRLRLLGHAERGVGEWRRFSPIDVVRLAVLARLAAHGLQISEGVEVVHAHLDPMLGGVVGCGVEIPPRLLFVTILLGCALHIRRTPLGIEVSRHPAPGCFRIDLSDIAADAIGRLPVPAGGSAAEGEIAPRAVPEDRQEGISGRHTCNQTNEGLQTT